MTAHPTDSLEVAALVAEGRHEEAAVRSRAEGQHARAAELFATVWKYGEAIACARQAGELADAYRYALTSRDRELTASLLEEVTHSPTEALKAARIAEDRHRTLDAAVLRHALGDLAEAARLFAEAGEPMRAAECQEALGDPRAAGMLYEQRIREAPEDARAALALGRILVAMGRFEPATHALQLVLRSSEATHDDARAARRLLVACFAAMGLSEAAGAVLDQLRAEDPTLPASVPEMLRATFGDARGLVSEAQRELIVGRYRVSRTLGEGSAGRVLAAEDTFYGRAVALKALRATGGAAGRDALARFAREARVAMGIDHPNVVRVLAYHAEGPYLVMELMEGGTLADRLGPSDAPLGPLVPSAAIAIGKSIARGLDAVHRRGVVHRDLKPGNVLFSSAGEPKISDFGVAHLIDLGATMTGAMMGTLETMAPEQINGSVKPDATTDLYALGMILHRALTGRLPFEGPDLALAHVDEVPAPASAHAAWLDEKVDALLARMLEKAQADRPSGASEVLLALEALPVRRYDDAFATRAPAAVIERPASGLSSVPPPSGPHASRYLDVITSGDRTLARDELLNRTVELRVLDDAERASASAWAKVRSPFVQLVAALDESTLVLEHDGSATDRPDPAQLHAALAAVHAAGLVHGSVDAAHVIVSPRRTTLRLPSRLAPDPTASADADRAALARLLAP
jgi:serine/threonine protein kinase